MKTVTNKPSFIYLPIENVDSDHCAAIVNKGLKEIPEILDSQVEINNNRVKIYSNKLEEIVPLAVKKIRDLGYGVTTIKKNFPILNMSCATCASSSQNILNNQKGVVSASVNYANESAQIEYIPTLVQTHDLKNALQEIGFDLVIEENEEVQDQLEEIHKKNFNKLKRRTTWAIIFSIPLVIIGMTPLMHQSWANWAMWILATPVVFVFGRQFFIGAYKQTKNRTANMDTLVALSTGVAYLFSVFNTLFPSFWTRKGLESHVYFEAAAVIITFILLGKILETRAKGNTSSAIKKLMGLQPKTVTILNENEEQTDLPIKSIQPGMLILVKPGEKIAVDGVVSSGSSFCDESMISGEPIPVEKSKGSKVFAGTINTKGSFIFKAEKVGSNTLLSQIIKTVQEAQGSKAPVQKLVDKIAGVFVPVVLIIAVITLILWIIFGGDNGFIYGLQCFVTVLVIACPCALGLATPTAIMVGMGKGAEQGILIKDAESLEIAKKTEIVVLDKTGTITEGKPKVQSCKWFAPETQEYKNILYSIEKSSEHPLADAITSYIKGDTINFISNIQIESITGKGIQGTIEQQTYYIGNLKLIKDNNIPISQEIIDWIEDKINNGETIVIFASTTQIVAVLSVSDSVKESSKEAIMQLQDMGIQVYMLTGDHLKAAQLVAQQVNIKDIRADVSPQGKIEFIKELQQSNKIVAMIGDGINDSAALAQANVSIAMGKGSDIAMDVAQITLISGDLLKVPQAIKLSKQTITTIKQNLFWAFIYNVIGIPLAAGVLYPINGFLLNPMIAGAAMALSSVSVVGNSILLKLKKA